MKKEFFENKIIVLEFAILSLLAGIMLISPNLTGNIISQKTSFINPLTIIGLGLNICSIILFAYLINKKR